MPSLHTDAGFEHPEPEPIAPEPSETEIALHAAEAEVARLKSLMRHQEAALKIAGRVLLPYLRGR